jgi:hypothetical protein
MSNVITLYKHSDPMAEKLNRVKESLMAVNKAVAAKRAEMRAANTKQTDNVITNNLLPTFREFLESIDFAGEGYTLDLQELEYESRDGFYAAGHNHGGLDLLNIVALDQVHYNNVAAPQRIYDLANHTMNEYREQAEQDNPDADSDKIDMLVQEAIGDYDTVARRVRVMYEGNQMIAIHYGWDEDAPYFRFNGKAECIEIKYKNKADLIKKMDRAARKISKYFK